MNDLVRRKREGSGATLQPPPRPSTTLRAAPPLAALREQSCPGVVIASFWVWAIATLAALLTAVITLTQFDRMHTALVHVARQHNKAAESAALDRAATVSIAVLISAGVLLALLQLALAAAMRSGRNWARIMLVVLVVASAFYCLLLFSGVNTTALGSISTWARAGLLLYIGLGCVAIVLMFFRGAQPWFRRRELIGP